MNILWTTGNITFALGILGVIFTVYNYLTKPQIDGDKKDALLAQQVQWTIEGNDRRFHELQNSIKDSYEIAHNHTNEAVEGIKALTVVVNSLTVQVAQLSTRLDERLPGKVL